MCGPAAGGSMQAAVMGVPEQPVALAVAVHAERTPELPMFWQTRQVLGGFMQLGSLFETADGSPAQDPEKDQNPPLV